MYSAECCLRLKKLKRASASGDETKTAGVTRLHLVRNDVITQKFRVAPIAEKMREARLRWSHHVLCEKEDSVHKIGINFEVIGKRPRGRPKQRCADKLHMDLKAAGVHPDLALGREMWRRNTRGADPATKRDTP
ncbi:unnamed protein product [Heligmosomoides polygyrus]|uniref:Transposase n=1 Tax=Heligmosomoides polygyrus TaxID=6339 RepID=A0A183FGW8_HELPZ|nr:unnamed protein product [Heligmosomoides polygyrus]